MRSRGFVIASLVAAVAAAACNGGKSHGGPGTTVTVSGTVFTLSSDGQDVSPASSASVTAAADFDGNGTIGAGESVTAETDGDGLYAFECPAEIGRRIVVTFDLEGYARALRTVDVQYLGEVTVNATLAPMDELECSGAGCTDTSGAVQISGVEIASGYARVFNPVADADKFPGEFADREGNMLVSAVFAAFDLYDEDDERIEDLGGETATVRLRTPRDTWGVIADLQAGNGQIDVPMYAFDEMTGEWVAEGTGWLEDGSGATIGEDQLGAIRDGTYTDLVFSVFEAGHFSYWNVDWPVETHACISGRVVDAAGSPVAGATVTVQGLTYAGTSSPQVTDADGRFCVDIMRSEGAGEDVNQNGITGETQQVILTVSLGEALYRFGPLDVPVAQSSCPTGCLDTGDLDLTPENEVEAALCTVHGSVLLDGAPVEGALVFANDDYLDDDVEEQICTYEAGCTGYAMTEADGAFSFTVAWSTLLRVEAWHTVEDGTVTMGYEAARSFITCPTEAVVLDLGLMSCYGEGLLVITYTAGVIDWTPDVLANFVMVSDAAGNPRWYVIADEGLAGPVTYGEVPAGAYQLFPYGGSAPTAVASGDVIMVMPMGGLVPYEGIMCSTSAQMTVP